MNKRHQTVFIIVALLIGILSLIFIMHIGDVRDTKALLSNGGNPSVSGFVRPSTTEDQSVDPVKSDEKQTLTVIKPKSIKMGEGATAVIEIDHGLQAVDFMKGDRYSAAVTRAREKGALGAVTFSVVDHRGQPVPGAIAKASFWNHGQKGHDFEKVTDENGLVALQDTCVGDLNFSVTKDGHYDTRLRYWFFKAYFDCAENGRWAPWNPVIEIVLKRRIDPVTMCVARSPSEMNITVPVLDVAIGFDFEKGDWLPPFGNGIHDDMQITREFMQTGEGYLDLKSVLILSFTNELCGVYEMERDHSSQLQSSYCANMRGAFVKNRVFTYNRTSNKILEDSFLPENKCLIFRTRIKIDENGDIVSAHYGKIYGRIDANRKGRLVMQYYFNPNENDPNLEADTSKNLLNPRDLGFAP